MASKRRSVRANQIDMKQKGIIISTARVFARHKSQAKIPSGNCVYECVCVCVCMHIHSKNIMGSSARNSQQLLKLSLCDNRKLNENSGSSSPYSSLYTMTFCDFTVLFSDLYSKIKSWFFLFKNAIVRHALFRNQMFKFLHWSFFLQ